MAFVHGKNTRLWIDGYELSKYFQEYTMSAKAGVAETTVFGVGAKTYIGGLREGTLSGKGFFGAASSDVVDAELSNALGNPGNMAITLVPSGLTSTAAGTRCVVAYAAETEYSVMAPVSGVVSTTMAAQADSGLKTGVILYNPDTAAITTTATTNGTKVDDVAGTDTAFTAAAAQTITTVISTAGLITTATITAGTAQSGIIMVQTSAGQAAFYYTSWTTTTFFGLTQIGTLAGVSTITATAGAISIPYLSNQGLIANLHLTGYTSVGGTGTATFNLQESDDNAVWATIAVFGPGQSITNTFSSTGPGGATGTAGANATGFGGSPGSGGAIVSGMSTTAAVTAVTTASLTPTITSTGTWLLNAQVTLSGLAVSGIANGVYTITTAGTTSFGITLTTATTATTSTGTAQTVAPVGGYTVLVSTGSPIARYLRIQAITATTAPVTLTFGVSAARQ